MKSPFLSSIAGKAALLVILLAAFAIRAPYISANLPYLHDEDEAHHFNRTVEMVKEGRFNPQYFHKPSLHFYLRMPAVAVAFIREVKLGKIRSVKELRTRDRFGLAGYSFSASHPAVLKAVRWVSVLLGLGSIILTGLIVRHFVESDSAALFAMFLAAVSPPFVQYSAVVGVDVVMTFFVLASVLAALAALKSYDFGPPLLILGVCCGLAVSSKYNAAPIALLPLLVVILRGKVTAGTAFIAVAAPAAGFLIGSPFILASIPMFLDHVAYEIWHYAVAGHEGHSAEPGFAQAAHYGGWLLHSALGYGWAVAAAVGALFVALRMNREALALLLFPILYFGLMCMQRANFERNMVVMIPFAAIFAGVFFGILRARLRGVVGTLIVAALALIAVWTPAAEARRDAGRQCCEGDTRAVLRKFLERQDPPRETAITGDLQPAAELLRMPSISVVATDEDFRALALQGYEQLITSRDISPGEPWTPERDFGGRPIERIVRSPAMKLWRLDEGAFSAFAAETAARAELRITPDAEDLCQSGAEKHCWVNAKVSSIIIETPISDKATSLSFEVMSPHKNSAVFAMNGRTQSIRLERPGTWEPLTLPLESRAPGATLSFTAVVAKISRPPAAGEARDLRRLGIALRNIKVNVE